MIMLSAPAQNLGKMEIDVYEYEPFVNAARQIRILRILPENDSDILRISLERVDLDEIAGEFDALSYTWGSEDNPRSILIDGKVMTIRYNLWSFLQHQRGLGNVHRPLWTDAVCINQQDIPEKNVQVARMGDLYRAAGRVLIWLSETSNLSDPYRLNKSYKEGSWMEMSREPSQFFLDRMEGRELSKPLAEENVETLVLLDQAMSIVYNPYWKRMWIVQEALLAGSLRIILGDELLDEGCIDMIWTVVSTEPEVLYSQWVGLRGEPNPNHLEVASLQNSPMLWLVIENAGREYQPDMQQHNEHSTFDFGAMLHFFGNSLCFNRRDRVYSLRGLTQAMKSICIDYNCTLEELCADALHCLGEEDYSGISFAQVQTLVQALGVTRTSCFNTFGSLPKPRAQSLCEERIDLGINVYGRLTTVSDGDSVDVRDCKKKTRIYSSKTASELFLNADFQNDNASVQGWIASNRKVYLICSLGTWPSMLLSRNGSGQIVVEDTIEMYQLPESDNVEHESYRVRPCSTEIKDLLTHRLNAPRLAWKSVYQGKQFEIEDRFITLSLLEIMQLYDLFSLRLGLTTQQDEAIYAKVDAG